MPKQIKNIGASVRAKLINIATESKRDYNAILRSYLQERFLYRLSISSYKSAFILKGALLLTIGNVSKFRPTKDIDFLSKGISNELDDSIGIIKEIVSIKFDDGIQFILDKITAEKIKEGADYEGVRIHLPYKLDTIKGYLSVDIGFGDKITVGPNEINFPSMLDFPHPKILVYSFETVVAEKFESIVNLNFISSRMKDLYDIIFIAANYKFNS